MMTSKKYIQNPIYISYTSLKDFLKCPRSYYLKDLYKDPKTSFRLQVASPYLSLGSVVHDSVKWFLDEEPARNASASVAGGEKPTLEQTIEKFRNFWLKFRKKRGGFSSDEEEGNFGRRGLQMIENFVKNWQVLEKAVPVVTFPKYNLVDNIVLIGNFDYIGQFEDGSLHVVDFKTGAKDIDDTLQLYIYAILAESNLGKEVSNAGFWYLDRDDGPKDIVLDPLPAKLDWLAEKAKELKKALEKAEWVCIKGDQLCRDCRDYQVILDGKAEFMFSDYRYKKDIYYLQR